MSLMNMRLLGISLMNVKFMNMNLFQMSISAAVMIIVIIVVRALAINKLPKKVFVLLWEVVLLRLLIPFSIPSMFSVYSIVRKSEPIRGALNDIPAATVITQIEEAPSNVIGNAGAIVPVQNNVPEISIWVIIWMVGMILCAVFFVVSYLRCYFEFQTSLPVRNEFTVKWLREHCLRRCIQIRQSDRISAPLTYGIMKPVILMPKKTDWENSQQLKYVLLHEYIHICRFDMVIKLITAFALCVHWFNPLVWVMYILFNRDIELSCDESVVRQFGEKSKSNYARTLITMEEKKIGLIPLYNSFSRNAIEERITAIMKTRKVTIGILIISVLVIISVVVPFATSAAEQKAQIGSEENVMPENSENETETEGIIGEAIEGSETALEMAKEVVSQKYAELKADGYSNWKIESLTEEYYYDFGGDLGGLRVTVYRLNYLFLAEDPENVTLAGGMTMDEDGWVVPEYAGSTYLCLVADGGALSYLVLVENDCFPGDEVFTQDLKQQLGIEETAEDYYAVATSESASAVEKFAQGIRNNILTKDWEALSEKISYPILIGGVPINDSADFLALDFDEELKQEFVDAISAETCRKMFCNWQGISMGATGQLWFGGVDNGNGGFELKIIGINGMIEEQNGEE